MSICKTKKTVDADDISCLYNYRSLSSPQKMLLYSFFLPCDTTRGKERGKREGQIGRTTETVCVCVCVRVYVCTRVCVCVCLIREVPWLSLTLQCVCSLHTATRPEVCPGHQSGHPATSRGAVSTSGYAQQIVQS